MREMLFFHDAGPSLSNLVAILLAYMGRCLVQNNSPPHFTPKFLEQRSLTTPPLSPLSKAPYIDDFSEHGYVWLLTVTRKKWLRIFVRFKQLHLFYKRCPTDETVKFYGAPTTARRFSFTAFQFINGPVEPYLYVHCDVKLCNLTDSKPSCMKECNDKLESRQRREVNTGIYDLERGPIIILKEKEYSLGNDAENEEMGDKRGNWNLFFYFIMRL